jgi:hypothetical protein
MDVAAPHARPLACADHPDRPAHARCMSCRKVLCDECATTWDGIHHCSRCLHARGTSVRADSAWLSAIVLAALVAALSLLHTQALVWLGSRLARLF